ncbi:LysE family translocator [Pseudomonas putida]|uniref:LysE family translocator n=1 Tax=Pseudomonas putida TaxID=303 RepID=UPI003D957780
MNTYTLLLFTATVLPLVCTPGPDILFVSSQALSGGTRAALRATTGVLLGYCAHSLMVALGLAAVVAASPILFEGIKWVGIAYLIYLAFKLIKSALQPGDFAIPTGQVRNQLYKGFLTSLLNPKGMMVYIAILPQFMDQHGAHPAMQPVILSAIFMFWCVVVYSAISIALGRIGKEKFTDKRRRQVDGTAGGMILLAAVFMSGAH